MKDPDSRSWPPARCGDWCEIWFKCLPLTVNLCKLRLVKMWVCSIRQVYWVGNKAWYTLYSYKVDCNQSIHAFQMLTEILIKLIVLLTCLIRHLVLRSLVGWLVVLTKSCIHLIVIFFMWKIQTQSFNPKGNDVSINGYATVNLSSTLKKPLLLFWTYIHIYMYVCFWGLDKSLKGAFLNKLKYLGVIVKHAESVDYLHN